MSSRRMIYPYTMTAKITQFPVKYFWKNSWPYRYYVYGLIVSSPFFLFIQNAVNSPANVAKFEESRRKAEEEHQEHLKHLL